MVAAIVVTAMFRVEVSAMRGLIDNVAGAIGPRHIVHAQLLALAIHRAVGCAGAEIAGLLQTLEIIEYGRRDGSAV